MKKLTLLIFIVLSSFSSFAINGLLVKTIDNSFQEKWYKTISSDVPKFIENQKVFKNQTFYITAIAWEFELDNNSSANVNYSIKVLKPDGSVHFEQDQLPLLNGKIENKDLFQMSEAILKISFEEVDSFGDYKIEVRIFDQISTKSKVINTSILLQELPSYDSLIIEKEEEFLKWFEKYYESPKPETALSYFLFYSQSSLAENDNSFLPIFSIFLEIFSTNKFLYNQILDSYSEQDEITKTYLIYLLHYSELGTEEFFNKLEGIEEQVYTEIKGSKLPELYGEITDPSQLDMLWATFSANGSYKPILKLIQTLEYSRFQGSLDKFEASDQTEEDRQKAINNAIYDSLIWSFKSNCNQDKLVKSYSKWALQYENLSDIQKSELKKILDSL